MDTVRALCYFVYPLSNCRYYYYYYYYFRIARVLYRISLREGTESFQVYYLLLTNGPVSNARPTRARIISSFLFSSLVRAIAGRHVLFFPAPCPFPANATDGRNTCQTRNRWAKINAAPCAFLNTVIQLVYRAHYFRPVGA